MADNGGNPAINGGENEWARAFKITWPLITGYLPVGLAFGMLMSSAGLPLWLTFLTSFMMYSGSAQLANIPLFVSGAGIGALAFNTFVINLRHIFYGIPLVERFPKKGFAKFLCYFGITDETFSIQSSLPKDTPETLYAKISVAGWLYWVVSATLGGIIGKGIGDLIPNLDFAMVCLFLVLWLGQYANEKDVSSSVAAILIYFLAWAFGGRLTLVIAIGASVVWIFMDYFVDVMTAGAVKKANAEGGDKKDGAAQGAKADSQVQNSGRLCGESCKRVSLPPSKAPLVARWLLLGLLLVFVLVLVPGNTPQAGGMMGAGDGGGTVKPMPLMWILACVAMGLVNFGLRSAPLVIPRKWFGSPLLMKVNRLMPMAVLAILVVAITGVERIFTAGGDMLVWADLGARVLALVTVALAHKLFGNFILSLATGLVAVNLFIWLLGA